MRLSARMIRATIEVKDGKIPEWVPLFADGWVEVEGLPLFLVDEEAFNLVNGEFLRRGNDIVFDYEHQTLDGVKAPAAGWIKELRYEAGVGISGRVEWTEEAEAYLLKGEYRYHSPVFYVRDQDHRLNYIHSVALTNNPRTNNIAPILAKLTATLNQEENMNLLQKLAAKLGLKPEASEEEVLAAVAKLQTPDTVVAAKEVLDALDAGTDSTVSSVVASINALKQAPKGMVSRTEFDAVVAKLDDRDANDAVSAAMKAGKITPDQKDWAVSYAKRDLDGFGQFVAKAPQVVPVGQLPGHQDDTTTAATDETTLSVAKMMGNSDEDLKTYGGGE